MTLSPWCTLQNVIQTQKCEQCQLNIPTTPFPAGGFPPDTDSSTRPKAQAWPQFNLMAAVLSLSFGVCHKNNIDSALHDSFVMAHNYQYTCSLLFDMIYCLTGYAAWRDQYRGSLYVRCFVDVLSREAHENDLHSMMVKVFTNYFKL